MCGTWEVDHLRAIAVNFMRLEPAFDALVPPSRRGNDNLHIRSLADLVGRWLCCGCGYGV